jgi:hypothetical protein
VKTGLPSRFDATPETVVQIDTGLGTRSPLLLGIAWLAGARVDFWSHDLINGTCPFASEQIEEKEHGHGQRSD